MIVYALKQARLYDEAALNPIRLRIKHRSLSFFTINTLCEKFGIHFKVTCIKEEAKGKNNRRPMIISINVKQRDYIGMKEASPNGTHTFNLYETHYFLEETTSFITLLYKSSFNSCANNKEFQNNLTVLKNSEYHLIDENLHEHF